jgi:hypothetical protein
MSSAPSQPPRAVRSILARKLQPSGTRAPMRRADPLRKPAAAAPARAVGGYAASETATATPTATATVRAVVDLCAAPALDIDALAGSLELSPAAAAAAAAEFDIALAQYMGEQLAARASVGDGKDECATLSSPVAVAHASFEPDGAGPLRSGGGGAQESPQTQ